MVRPFTGAAVVAGALPPRMRLTGEAQVYTGFRVQYLGKPLTSEDEVDWGGRETHGF